MAERKRTDSGSSNSEQRQPLLIIFWLPLILATIAIAPDIIGFFRSDPARTVQSDQPVETSGSDAFAGAVISDTDCSPLKHNLQICWGRENLGNSGGHVRHFDFEFADDFAGAPQLATSIDVASSRYAFSVFNSSISETRYAGDLVEIGSRSNDAPVSMSYIAIGRPK